MSATVAALRALALAGARRRAGKATSAEAEWAAAVALREAHVAPIAEAVARAARSVAAAARPRLERLAREAADAKATGVTPAAVARAYDLAAWAEAVLAEVAPEVAAAALGGFRVGLLRAGVVEADWDGFNASSARVRRAVRETVALVQGAGETTRDALVRAVLAGGDADAIVARVAGVLASVEDVAAGRAAVIGRTSATAAYEAGQVDAFVQAGVEKKRWLSSRDALVRAEHAALDGEEVGVEEAFSNGLEYPSEPNCRCVVLPVIPPAEEKGAPTWARRRNGWMRSEYLRRRQAGEERGELIEALSAGEFEGRAYSLAFDTARKACDGLTP